MIRRCQWFNDVHQASVWFVLDILYYVAILLNPVDQASLWHKNSMAQCCAGLNLWYDVVQKASQYGRASMAAHSAIKKAIFMMKRY